MPENEGQFATNDEKILHRVAMEHFLSLWTYSNLFRDQGKVGPKGDGKELIDLAVLCGDNLILFSDKRITYNHGSGVVEWMRFIRKSIFKSIDQLNGAARWIGTFPNRVFLDKSCTIPIPIRGFDNVKNIELIVVCHGAEAALEKANRDLLLAINQNICNGENLDPTKINPFEIGIFTDVVKNRFYHVFNGESLLTALREFNTITDFMHYLNQRKSLLLSGRGSPISEHNIITAFYKSFDEKLFKYDLLSYSSNNDVSKTDYSKLINNAQYRARRAANENSYLIDGMIECFSHHQILGTSYNSNIEKLSEFEGAIAELAILTRFERRMLANAILSFREKIPLIQRGTRLIVHTNCGYKATLLLCLPDSGREKYREVRRHMLSEYCSIAKYEHIYLKTIIGIGMRSAGSITDIDAFINEGLDFILLSCEGRDDEIIANGKEAYEAYVKNGLLAKRNQIPMNDYDFPKVITLNDDQARPTNNRFKSSELNKLCFCNSGKKFKKCCMHKIRRN